MIGVFDSGLGGLTILKHFLNDLPQYDYIYLGDNARVPYGSKSPDLIYQYSVQAVDFLFSQGCELIIFACNSASSQALRKIQTEDLPKKYPGKKILGVIRPLAEQAVQDNFSKIGVIGTAATISSGVYKKEIKKLNSKIQVIEKATPLLVSLIEENWLGKPETKMILKKYLRSLKMKQVKALILACTHYPFLLKEIRRIMGKSCLVYDPGHVVSASLKDYLGRHLEIKLATKKKSIIKFYTTDKASNFKVMGERFLGRKISKVEHINLP